MSEGVGLAVTNCREVPWRPTPRAPTRVRQVAVIGAGGCEEGSEPWRLAEEVGRLLAEAGVTVVCGGRGGVMEAVARGARRRPAGR